MGIWLSAWFVRTMGGIFLKKDADKLAPQVVNFYPI